MTPQELLRLSAASHGDQDAAPIARPTQQDSPRQAVRVIRPQVDPTPKETPSEEAKAPSRQIVSAPVPLGPGRHLLAMMREIGATACQPCWSTARKMDDWGPGGCRERRAEIVAEIAKNAKAWSLLDRLGLAAGAATKAFAWNLSPLDPYGSLVDEAIRRAESA